MAFDFVAEPGLKAVNIAVPATATFAAGTSTDSCAGETNVVACATPFQFNSAPGTKPVPFTSIVKAPLPGVTTAGVVG